MSCFKIFQILLIQSLLYGCASTPISYKNNIDAEVMSLSRKFAKADSNRTEITQPISHLFSYLKTQYPEQKWRHLSAAHSDTTKSLESKIQSIYGKSLYRIAGGEMQFKERFPYSRFDSLDSFVVGFVKVVSPNKISDTERMILISQLDSYTKSIDSILSTDTTLKERFYAGLIRMRDDGKILIVLATNPDQAGYEGLKRNYAITKCGYYESQNDSAVFAIRIATKYFGLISAATIMHELVHAVVAAIQVSPNQISIPYYGLKELRIRAKAMSDSSQEMMVSEGLAESISQKYNPIYSSGHFNPIDYNMTWQKNKYGRSHSFKSAGECYNGRYCSFDGRILALYQAGSFVNFLAEEYGYAKVFHLATSSPSESNYLAIFGKSKNEIVKGWIEKTSL